MALRTKTKWRKTPRKLVFFCGGPRTVTITSSIDIIVIKYITVTIATTMTITSTITAVVITFILIIIAMSVWNLGVSKSRKSCFVFDFALGRVVSGRGPRGVVEIF